MNGFVSDSRVLERATYLMWLNELNAVKENGVTPDWDKRKAAAEQIVTIVGARDLIKAIALDGELRPAPPWPQVDIVPVGGGPGLITCEVRTWVKGRGKLKVKIVLYRQKGKKFDSDKIGEAMERGKFELKKIIETP